MKKMNFPAVMIGTAIISCALTILWSLLYAGFHAGWLLTMAITFGTVFYHFSMRLLVGALIPNRFDHTRFWFRPRKFEPKLYKALHIRKWKDRVPTYDPRLFSMESNTLSGIIKNMCQAEVVHEVIIACSFLPILCSLFLDGFWAFAITSVLAAGLDSIFVMLQRFNRPRLVRLLEKQHRKGRFYV